MKTENFPLTIKEGSVSVKIYRTPTKGCESFTLTFYQDGVRKRRTHANLQAAKEEARLVSRRLGSVNADVLTLDSADRAAYLRARQLLDPLGASLEVAAAQYAHALQHLGEVPLAQAVEYYLKQHPSKIVSRMVKEVVAEMLQFKKSDQVSERYLHQLRYDLEKFAGAFSCTIGYVRGPEVARWLRSLGVSPRTRNNIRASVKTLFAFAKAQRYLPKDHDEIESVLLAKTGVSEIEIFTPKEMTELLEHAEVGLIPFLALGGFAGIRHAEIERLHWNDIQFDAGIIEIKAAKAKTASRRTVPILDNLKAWLQNIAKPDGAVCGNLNLSKGIQALVGTINVARRAAWAQAKGISPEQLRENEALAGQAVFKVKGDGGTASKPSHVPPGAETAQIEGWTPFVWKHNALRHSFISYRVAETQNVAQVSLEAGNSPQMIFKHYRELVRPTAAKEWFAIVPKDPWPKQQTHDQTSRE